jgi:YVTN family beta-propeller protein
MYVGGVAGSIAVIDTDTNRVSAVAANVFGVNPFGLAITPDGSRIYVGGGPVIRVWDTATNTLVTEIKGCSLSGAPSDLAVAPDGTRIYAATGYTVCVIDAGTNTVVAKVKLGFRSRVAGVAVGADGSRVYVAHLRDNLVSVIDTATNKVVSTVTVGGKPRGVATTPRVSRGGPRTPSI